MSSIICRLLAHSFSELAAVTKSSKKNKSGRLKNTIDYISTYRTETGHRSFETDPVHSVDDWKKINVMRSDDGIGIQGDFRLMIFYGVPNGDLAFGLPTFDGKSKIAFRV